jgi:hypothetical protein
LAKQIGGFVLTVRDYAARVKEWQPLLEYSGLGIMTLIEKL